MNDLAKALEEQRLAMEKLMISDYKSNEGTCSGSLSLSKIAGIMSTRNLGSTEVLYIGRRVSQEKYFIFIKNTNTGEECMHDEPVRDLNNWQVYFLEKPIFHKINIKKI
jgi:hypothetical protein